MRNSYVYVLYCEDSNGLYVGKSFNPEHRHKEHLRESKSPRIKRQYWVRSILENGYKLETETLVECPENEVNFYETFYIHLFRNLGFELMNLTEGGDGFNGFKQSKETIEKRVAKLRGRKMPAHVQEAILKATVGRKASLREKLIISLRFIGRKDIKGNIPGNKGRFKLSPEQISDIKVKLQNGQSGASLSREYKVSGAMISSIKNEKHGVPGWGCTSSAESWKSEDKIANRKYSLYLCS